MDKTRQYDLEELRSGYRHADPLARKLINTAGKKIQMETGRTAAYREALLRETRKGKVANVIDIRNEMKKHGL